MCLNETDWSVGFVITLFPYSSAKKASLKRLSVVLPSHYWAPFAEMMAKEGIEKESTRESRAMRGKKRACIKERVECRKEGKNNYISQTSSTLSIFP